MSDLNQSAIRKHALECSVRNRGGKFTRVGQDFFEELDGEVEALVREIRNVKYPVVVHQTILTEESFVTGPLLEKLREALNAAIGRLIQQKVLRQPSVGVTIGRTR